MATATPTAHFTNNATINFDGDNKVEKAHADDVHQINKVWADQSQNVAAGNGGDGGDGNVARVGTWISIFTILSSDRC